MNRYNNIKISNNLEINDGEIDLKRWECVQVNHHKNVGKVIEEWESNGWKLHTYNTAQFRGSEVNHYLLFEKGA